MPVDLTSMHGESGGNADAAAPIANTNTESSSSNSNHRHTSQDLDLALHLSLLQQSGSESLRLSSSADADADGATAPEREAEGAVDTDLPSIDDAGAYRSLEDSLRHHAAQFTERDCNPNPLSGGEAPDPRSQHNPVSMSGQICSNCGTTRTPLWRRSPQGETICNACGLYYKARNLVRPTNMNRHQHHQPAPGNAAQDPSTPQATDCAATPPATTPAPASAPALVVDDPATHGTCPGGGRCNGTGGSQGCGGCPAYNNRISKAQQSATHPRRHDRQSLGPGENAANAGSTSHLFVEPASSPLPGLQACQNCGTTVTPLWRRGDNGNTICNACGLYFKLHGRHRPTGMNKSEIKRRKRIMPAAAGTQHMQFAPNGVRGAESSASPDPTQPDSPGSLQRPVEQATTAGADTARRAVRTLQIDYTGYVPPSQQPSTLQRKRSRSADESNVERPALRVQRTKPSIPSLLVDGTTDDSAIDPSLRGKTDELAMAREEKSRRRAQKQLEVELMRERLSALEHELKELEDGG